METDGNPLKSLEIAEVPKVHANLEDLGISRFTKSDLSPGERRGGCTLTQVVKNKVLDATFRYV